MSLSGEVQCLRFFRKHTVSVWNVQYLPARTNHSSLMCFAFEEKKRGTVESEHHKNGTDEQQKAERGHASENLEI